MKGMEQGEGGYSLLQGIILMREIMSYFGEQRPLRERQRSALRSPLREARIVTGRDGVCPFRGLLSTGYLSHWPQVLLTVSPRYIWGVKESLLTSHGPRVVQGKKTKLFRFFQTNPSEVIYEAYFRRKEALVSSSPFSFSLPWPLLKARGSRARSTRIL